MRTINNGIPRIKGATEDTFFDNCILVTYSGIQDSYGDVIQANISGAEISCGFEIVNGSKNYRGDIVVSEVDAKVRLPLGTTITPQDYINITKRNGAVVSGFSYSVDAVLDGMSCITCLCKVLEG